MANMLLVVGAAIIMLMDGISAEKYTVGDDEGWTLPPSPDFYSSWAADHTFVVGDVLAFEITGLHTVAMVTKEAYEKCDEGEAKAITESTEFTLNKTGSFYFICTIGDHCASDQKLEVTVAASAISPALSPDESPSDVGSSPSPPMPRASTFFYFTTFMASVIALQY